MYFSRFAMLFGIFAIFFAWAGYKFPELFFHGRRSGFWVDLIGEEGTKKLIRWVSVPLVAIIGGITIGRGAIHEKMIWQAKHDNATAQFELADHFQRGDFQDKDLETAVKWYTRAAENGSIPACIHLAEIYSAGERESNNPVRAFNWYLAAARLGDLRSQKSVAYRYLEGIGVEINVQQAAYWYEKAAEEGSTSARINLGIMVLKHFRDVPALAAKARGLLEEAVAKNDSKGAAARVLVQMTMQGIGCPTDRAKGYAWSCLAAARGSEEARMVRDALDQHMPPQAKRLAEAQRQMLFKTYGVETAPLVE